LCAVRRSKPEGHSGELHAAERLAPTSFAKSGTEGNIIIITFVADAIRDVENVIARELEGLTAGTSERHLLLDLSHVECLNSVELGTLITMHKQARAAGGRLTLFNLSADVFKLFSVTRLDTLLEICREEVVAHSDPPPGATDGPHPPEM
jgi:anti-anti-sigma factor